MFRYEGYPCNVSCLNQGICFPGFNKFKCKCMNGYTGKFCQKVNGRKVRNSKFSIEPPINHYNFYVFLDAEVGKKSDLEAIYLDGHTELFYKNRIYDIMKTQNTNKFELSFKTRVQNGLLLFTGNGNLKSFLYLAIVNGKFVYSFSLPKQKQSFSLSSKTKLNDNNWHSVVVERSDY